MIISGIRVASSLSYALPDTPGEVLFSRTQYGFCGTMFFQQVLLTYHNTSRGYGHETFHQKNGDGRRSDNGL
jgi:hypothetical protein